MTKDPPCKCDAYPFPHRKDSNPRQECEREQETHMGVVGIEYRFCPHTRSWYMRDVHESLTIGERNA
jgi:hypothetical protein